ncbi:ABC transporter permease [Pararobbsia silviterrae]|uniref:ABC transporter permease n=1 Tax=Pararobbsia silviterrae TaxID=1792498 RepID=A0A494XJJ1_9BURK|nr:ABC transporter permease [Pararobbsia silviterrae]RKP47733.1 ABC transporter permease [Pararobbsia silviterrae]
MNSGAWHRFGRSFAIQRRVIFALIMREIITRYGRNNIGFAWLFAEPMLFTIGITVLWSVAKENAGGHHINIIAFAITSYTTVLMWRNTIGNCTHAVVPNQSLLFHRNVKIIDFFFARIILEISGVTFSTAVLFLALLITGLIPPPADVLTMIGGWILLAWYSIAMGLLIGALCQYDELVERIWHPLAYFQLPVSGAFAMASWLPTPLRKVVLLFPAANCAEIVRDGYFGDAIKSYYDAGYVATICLVLTWLGLLAVRGAARRLA